MILISYHVVLAMRSLWVKADGKGMVFPEKKVLVYGEGICSETRASRHSQVM